MLSKLLTDLVLVCFAVREMSIPQLCCVVFVFNPKDSDKSQRGKECKGAQESAGGGGGGGGWGGGWSVRRLHNHAAAANMCGSNSDL